MVLVYAVMLSRYGRESYTDTFVGVLYPHPLICETDAEWTNPDFITP